MKTRTVADVDLALRRSSLRTAAYRAKGDKRSVEIERNVQNRLLDERNELQKRGRHIA